MNLTASTVEPWQPNFQSHRPNSTAFQRAKWTDSTGPPPSHAWEESQPSGGVDNGGEIYGGWERSDFSGKRGV